MRERVWKPQAVRDLGSLQQQCWWLEAPLQDRTPTCWPDLPFKEVCSLPGAQIHDVLEKLLRLIQISSFPWLLSMWSSLTQHGDTISR